MSYLSTLLSYIFTSPESEIAKSETKIEDNQQNANNREIIVEMKEVPLEIWQPLEEFEGRYMVSNTGQVKSMITGKIIVPISNGKVYLMKTWKQWELFSPLELFKNSKLPENFEETIKL